MNRALLVTIVVLAGNFGLIGAETASCPPHSKALEH